MPSVSQTVLILLGSQHPARGLLDHPADERPPQGPGRPDPRQPRSGRGPRRGPRDPRHRYRASSRSRSAAIAVSLHNSSPDPLDDLPVLVGVRTAGGTVLVNHGGGFRYFETHTPGLAPKGDTTWVFTAPAKKVPAGEPVVRVGRADEPPHRLREPPGDPDLPRLDHDRQEGDDRESDRRQRRRLPPVRPRPSTPGRNGTAHASPPPRNRSETSARARNGRSGFPLICDPGKAKVHVFAPPTIFE